MDAPAMPTRSHATEDVGHRNGSAEEGGQQQMHRPDEKQHKPVLKKVKDKVKKIKKTITSHGHGHGNGDDDHHEHGSNSSDEDKEDAAQRQAEVEKEVKGNDASAVRLRDGDLSGPVVEDPAAPRSATPEARGGEDIGTTDVVRDFERMNVRDDPSQVGAGKMDVVDERTAGVPVSDGTGEEWKDAPSSDDAATNATSGGSYTDRLKNTAAGTTELGKKLASTVYEKVAGAGTVVARKSQQVIPGFGAGGSAQDDSSETTGTTTEPMTAGARKMDVDEPRSGTPVSNTTTEGSMDATTGGAAGGTYTDKIKSAVAGTTEYGRQLASTVYQKAAGVSTAVTGKVQQQATPSAGAKGTDESSAKATPGAGGQDKGVTGVTAYIAEKLRPGDEERSLSEAITGAVQQRKEGVGSTVAKAWEAPSQAVTMAREAVTSLTGGSRVSESVQPTTEGDIKGGVAMEGPELRGAKI